MTLFYNRENWQKWLLLSAVIVIIIYAGVYFFFAAKKTNPYVSVYPQPTVEIQSPRSSNNHGSKVCATNSDCSSDEVCKQSGPIVVDPVTKKRLTQKTCWQKESPLPL